MIFPRGKTNYNKKIPFATKLQLVPLVTKLQLGNAIVREAPASRRDDFACRQSAVSEGRSAALAPGIALHILKAAIIYTPRPYRSKLAPASGRTLISAVSGRAFE